jgi:hypothetical protein
MTPRTQDAIVIKRSINTTLDGDSLIRTNGRRAGIIGGNASRSPRVTVGTALAVFVDVEVFFATLGRDVDGKARPELALVLVSGPAPDPPYVTSGTSLTVVPELGGFPAFWGNADIRAGERWTISGDWRGNG